MKHFFTTKVKAVIIIAVLLTAALAVIGNLTGKTLPETLVQGILTPLRTGASSLTSQAERFYDYIFRYEALEAENISLKEQLAQMQDAAREADSVSRENDRLRALLELKKANEDFDLVDGYVISRSSQDWNSSFTVNRGTDSGITEGMCVITANGEVVGLVSEVGSNYCIVKTVLDSSIRISATIFSSGTGGIVQGGYLMGNEHYLRMDNLPSTAVVVNGDQVVTAGSTIYPRNLILGYAVDAGMTETQAAMYAILRPAADISRLEQVFIITNFGAE